MDNGEIPDIQKLSNSRLLVVFFCGLTLGAFLGYGIAFISLEDNAFDTANTSSNKNKTVQTEKLEVPQTGATSTNQVEQIKDSVTPVASKDTDTIPLEEVVAPIVTPEGKIFSLTYKGTKVTMDYPASVRILKVGYYDKDSMNYGRKDFDPTKEVTYILEQEVNGYPLKAEIHLGEVKQSYGNKDSEMVYELYGNQFYFPGGTTAFTPNSTVSTKDGNEVHDFTWGDANSMMLEYVILDRRFEAYSKDNITTHNVSTAVTLRADILFDEYEENYQFIEQTRLNASQFFITLLKSIHFERVPIE